MAMRIAMRWNREPNWFYTLDPSTKAKVIAEYRLHCESPEDKKARQEAQKRARMEAMIQKRLEQ